MHRLTLWLNPLGFMFFSLNHCNLFSSESPKFEYSCICNGTTASIWRTSHSSCLGFLATTAKFMIVRPIVWIARVLTNEPEVELQPVDLPTSFVLDSPASSTDELDRPQTISLPEEVLTVQSSTATNAPAIMPVPEVQVSIAASKQTEQLAAINKQVDAASSKHHKKNKKKKHKHNQRSAASYVPIAKITERDATEGTSELSFINPTNHRHLSCQRLGFLTKSRRFGIRSLTSYGKIHNSMKGY